MNSAHTPVADDRDLAGMRRLFSALVCVVLLTACATTVPQNRVQFPTAPGQGSALGHVYRPSGAGPFPAIVLLHGGGGLDRYVLEWASWLAGLGYVALAVDSGRLAPAPTIFDHASGAVTYLRSLPFVAGEQLGIMGFSRGGAAALNIATLRQPHAPEFRAAIVLYPVGCSYQIKSTKVPLLLLLGELDGSPEPCVDMTRRLNATSTVPVELVLYPKAYHAFDNPELRAATSIPWFPQVTVLYDASAASAAHDKVQQFLAEHVGGRQ